MGLFSALNAKVLAAIDRRSGVSRLAGVALADDRLVLTHADGSVRQLPWRELRRAVGLRRDLYAGDEISVLLEFAADGVVEVLSSLPGWSELGAALDALEGASRSTVWLIEVMAAPIGHGTPIWSAIEGSDSPGS